ncbi:MAG TPA: VCBS repeat-containing protein [Candidatus Peribacterales bacterium]|nr:VCBS repeat-containing protein [Candidatus Peribacterales bacterium]
MSLLSFIRNYRRKHIGFTILDLLLAMAIISTITTVMLTTVSPAYFLAKTRNAERWIHVDELIDAVAAYTIDHDGFTPPNVQIPPTPGSLVFAGPHLIHDDYNGARAVEVHDIDGDGMNEVVSTAQHGNDKDVTVWEHTGAAPDYTWTPTIVDQSNWKGFDVAVGDIDGDGPRDIVGIDAQSNDIAWWRNLGGTPATFDARRMIETNYRDMRSLALSNIDGATGLDVLIGARGLLAVPVRWYENDGTPINGGWNSVNIDDFLFEHHAKVIASDMDSDNDQDVIAAEDWHLFAQNRLFIYKNDGTPEGAYWTRYALDTGESGARSVAVGNMDGDGDMDVVGISLNGRVSWHENDGTPLHASWVKHAVTTTFGGENLAIGDLDNDGDEDIVAASAGGDKIVYWKNLGNGSFSGTSVIAFGSDVNGVTDIALKDLDIDGDLDITSANAVAKTVSWLENLLIHGSSPPAPQAGIGTEYKSICRGGISVAECDAYGGVALDVLVPGYLTALPVDPKQDDDTATGAILSGFEISIAPDRTNISIRAPYAENGETIELIGPVGTDNCLVWDIMQGQRTCVLFE